MDYRPWVQKFPLGLIYNSRNFKWTIDIFSYSFNGYISTIVEILNGL